MDARSNFKFGIAYDDLRAAGDMTHSLAIINAASRTTGATNFGQAMPRAQS